MCTCGYNGLSRARIIKRAVETRWLVGPSEDAPGFQGVRLPLLSATEVMRCSSCLRPRTSRPIGGGNLLGYEEVGTFFIEQGEVPDGEYLVLELHMLDFGELGCLRAPFDHPETGPGEAPLTVRGTASGLPQTLLGEPRSQFLEPTEGLSLVTCLRVWLPWAVTLDRAQIDLELEDRCLGTSTPIAVLEPDGGSA